MFHPKGPTFWELAGQALSSTQRGYDLLAPKFEYTPFRTPEAILEAVGRELSCRQPIENALDVCCGTGAAMRMLGSLCRKNVVGVDFSRGMLREAASQLEGREGLASFRLVRADVFALPFTGAFDLITCFGALGHVLPEDQPRWLRSIAACLRPRGRFALVASPRPPLCSSRYWLAAAFDAAMHVRNRLWKPAFIMYYLTFPLARLCRLLVENGFSIEDYEGIFPEPFQSLHLVIGTLEA